MQKIIIMKQIFSNTSIFSITLAIILLFFSFTLVADERTENIDVFLVLDKSLSMVEEIDAVADYVVEELVEKTLIPGDFFLLIQFYGKAETLFTREITSTGPVRESIIQAIRSIEADGHFTDIGNALDTLRSTLGNYENRDRRRYMLLITDGKQEAPPESKYYSPDGSFNHEFLKNSKVIQKQGWKIHILGIGTGTSAKELAENLSATYSEVPEEPSPEELAAGTVNLLGTIEVNKPVNTAAFSSKGQGRLKLTLNSSGYDTEQTITIKRLFVSWEGTEYPAADNIVIAVPPGGSAEAVIPLVLTGYDSAKSRIAAGSIEIRTDFLPGTVFTPSIFEVQVAPVSFLERFWPLLLGLLLVLILIGLIVFLIVRGTFTHSKLHIEVDLEDSGQKKFFDLGSKTLLFISEGVNGIGVAVKKTGEILATLHTEGDQLIMKAEKEDILLGGPVKGNILGKHLKIRDRYGKFKGISFFRKT